MKYQHSLRRSPLLRSLASALWLTLAVTTTGAIAELDAPRTHAHMATGEHGKMADKHGVGRGMQPHNIASHFLSMAKPLKLSDDQIKQLTQWRDAYLEKNATAEEQLKAAKADLTRELFADEIDLAKVEALFERIGRLDAQLWRAFAKQLHDVKALLTSEQKKSMKAMWSEKHHGGHGMSHGEKPGHAGAK